MAHSFWRGEFIVCKRSDETADIYEWVEPLGFYRWHSDWDTPEQAHRYIEEVEAMRPFPEIKPITILPKLQDAFDRVWIKQQARRAR